MHAPSPPDATLVGVKPLLLALAATALALSAPGLAAAQSAGDEQYEDPIVNEPDSGGGGGGGGPDTPVSSPAEPGDAAPTPGAGDLPPGAEPVMEDGAVAAAGSETLPLTGADTGLLAALGLALLAAGALLARRLAVTRG